jgi:hypothetical protein
METIKHVDEDVNPVRTFVFVGMSVVRNVSFFGLVCPQIKTDESVACDIGTYRGSCTHRISVATDSSTQKKVTGCSRIVLNGMLPKETALGSEGGFLRFWTLKIENYVED